MSGLTGDFDGKIDFDVLHFINSSNVSPLIVRSSYDSSKNIKSSIPRNLCDFFLFPHCCPYRILFHRLYCFLDCRSLQNYQDKVRSLIVDHQSSKTHTRV
jgi:hypothetical protein